jgi:hypothetical protein
MATKSEVESFLSQLKTKAKTYKIVFRNRDKNIQGLADLDILPFKREEVILNLSYQDYVSGPNKDSHDPDGPDYFVFGKSINGGMAYIKISLGRLNKPVDCMSFHKAEHTLSFPVLKN